MYEKIVNYLLGGLSSGISSSTAKSVYLPSGVELQRKLQENIVYFSKYKTNAQVLELVEIVKKNADLGYAAFEKEALPLLNTYNRSWLQSEYNATQGQAQSAMQWADFEAGAADLPYLKYQTIGDANVRPEHRRLNGIIRPVGDAFWNRYAPLNGWGCRCDLVQVDASEVPTDVSNFKDLTDKEQPQVFRHNPGITGTVFEPSHPYFQTV